MVGKKGNAKLLSEITKTEKTTETNGNRKNGQQKIGQRENSATKNDSVGKRARQSYIVSTRDGNSCLGNRNKKLSYRRGTARCVVSVEILPTATPQSRNYLYDKS